MVQELTPKEIQSYYEQEAEDVPIFGSLREISLAENILESLPSSFDSLIDIGCGDGYVLCCLREKYPLKKLFGLDLSELRIQTTHAHVPDSHLIQSEVHSLPFPDNTFDVVICSELLEHIPEYTRTIEELIRISRKKVIITVPNELQLVKIMCPKCKTTHFLDGHINFFTENKLIKILAERADCTLKKTKKFHSIYTYNRLTMKLPRLLRLFLDQSLQKLHKIISFLKPNFLLVTIEKKDIPKAP